MSNPSSPNGFLPREEELMQLFFDELLTDAEEEELLGLLQKNPTFFERVHREYEVEHLLRFCGDIQRKPISFALKTEKSFRLSNKPAPFFTDGSSSNFIQNHRLRADSPAGLAESIEWSQLVALAASAESTSLPAVEEFSAPEVAPLKTRETKPVYRISHHFLAATILLLIVLAVFSEFLQNQGNTGRRDSLPPPLAHVTAIIDLEPGQAGTGFKKGQRIDTERLRFESGLLELRLKNDVRLVLNGPVDFRLDSESVAFCERGRISAEVSRRGRGFEIGTPHLAIVDLGTEFTLHVDENAVEAHCISGKIVGRNRSRETLELSTGSGFRMPLSETWSRITADVSTYFSSQKTETLRKAYETEELTAWREQSRSWSERPDLLVHFDFENGGKSFPNKSARGSRMGTDIASLSRGKKDTGRWTGKSAVAFRNRNDALDLNVSTELNSFTLFASTRVDRLDGFSHVLLASRSFGPGKVFWQIGNNGILQLLIQPYTGVASLEYASPPHFTSRDMGTWCAIACVVDMREQTVTHYVDGREIARIPLRETDPVRIGWATLGNGLWEQDTPVDRHLEGAVDEFMLFDAALSPEEIADLSRYH